MSDELKAVVNAAIEWVESNYLRSDLTPNEVELCESVNVHLEREQQREEKEEKNDA